MKKRKVEHYQAGIEIADGRYFAALWYLDSDTPRRGNWMGALFRNADGTWELKYRFRYYNDDVTDETTTDDKSWHGFKKQPGIGVETEAEMVAGVDLMLSLLQATGYGRGYKVQKVEPKSDRADDVIKALRTQSYAQFSQFGGDNPLPLSIRPVTRGTS